MPVIGIPVEMLLARLQGPMEREHLVEHLQHLGCDVEGYATLRRFRCRRCDNLMEITETENPPVLCDRCGADYKQTPVLLEQMGENEVIRMELLAVRPDMFDPGGLARVLRHYLGRDPEPANYPMAEATWSVRVEPSVTRRESYRPSIACAIVRDITLNDDRIKVIMKLQESLHWALGRDRKHASIGIYDLEALTGPEVVYRAVRPEDLRFIPLGYYGQKSEAEDEDAEPGLTPKEILEQHPKGRAYARLLEGWPAYPLLCDAAGQVMSMPPIINSEATRVTKRTQNFFVDVTGTEERVVSKALNILVSSLAEIDPGSTIEQVEIVSGRNRTTTPNLTPQVVELDTQHVARTIGVPLSSGAVQQNLQRMGHGVESDQEGRMLEVTVPAYRNDIMHPIDLVEDVAIAYGYHNIEPQLVPTLTLGAELDSERNADGARRAMTGLGYLEVLTLLLSSEELQFDALQLPRREDTVVIENPISVEQTMVRASLLPGLLDTFSVNTDHEMPQRVFEVGNISLIDDEVETGAREHRRVAGAVTGPRADYAEIRATCEALMRELGWQIEVLPDPSGCFIPGRGARVLARRDDQLLQLGLMGEIHPQVLENFKLVQPVAAFEVDLRV